MLFLGLEDCFFREVDAMQSEAKPVFVKRKTWRDGGNKEKGEGGSGKRAGRGCKEKEGGAGKGEGTPGSLLFKLNGPLFCLFLAVARMSVDVCGRMRMKNVGGCGWEIRRWDSKGSGQNKCRRMSVSPHPVEILRS